MLAYLGKFQHLQLLQCHTISLQYIHSSSLFKSLSLKAEGSCLATHVDRRDIQSSSVSGPLHLLTHGKALDILEHSNSLLSPGSIDLSPFDHNSTSPDDPDCSFAFPASNAHDPLPTTSNFSISFSSIQSSCAVHSTTGSMISTSSCESPEASRHSPNQQSGPEVTRSSPPVVKDALPRARSPAVEVVGLQPLKKAPRGNSVKQYHR